MFKRKRNNDAEDSQIDDAESEQTIASAQEPAQTSKEPVVDRSEGPWDAAEAPDDGMVRLDFGALQIPGVDGMSVNLEVDEASQQVVAITVVLGEGGIQLQPFAAPRSGDFWPEVRGELTKSITSSGGLTDEAEGPFGAELRANVPATNETGEQGMQQVRFVGVEGPRWLLRGVMLGIAAADERGAEVFEEIFRGCIVIRGTQPMAPGDMLPLTLPPDAVANEEEAQDPGELEADRDSEQERPPLDPFERGPEITEIR